VCGFPDVFCCAGCDLESAEERCVPRIEVGAGGFGDEWRVVVKDGRQSVVVGLYEILECCRRVLISSEWLMSEINSVMLMAARRRRQR